MPSVAPCSVPAFVSCPPASVKPPPESHLPFSSLIKRSAVALTALLPCIRPLLRSSVPPAVSVLPATVPLLVSVVALSAASSVATMFPVLVRALLRPKSGSAPEYRPGSSGRCPQGEPALHQQQAGVIERVEGYVQRTAAHQLTGGAVAQRTGGQRQRVVTTRIPVLFSCAAFTVRAFPASWPSLNSCAAVSVNRFWLSRAPVLSSLPVAESVRASSV